MTSAASVVLTTERANDGTRILNGDRTGEAGSAARPAVIPSGARAALPPRSSRAERAARRRGICTSARCGFLDSLRSFGMTIDSALARNDNRRRTAPLHPQPQSSFLAAAHGSLRRQEAHPAVSVRSPFKIRVPSFTTPRVTELRRASKLRHADQESLRRPHPPCPQPRRARAADAPRAGRDAGAGGDRAVGRAPGPAPESALHRALGAARGVREGRSDPTDREATRRPVDDDARHAAHGHRARLPVAAPRAPADARSPLPQRARQGNGGRRAGRAPRGGPRAARPAAGGGPPAPGAPPWAGAPPAPSGARLP